MAGIYIHVPFCKTRCTYCDFFSNTSMRTKETYITALEKEIAHYASTLSDSPIKTLYFGGGTPSQLEAADWKRIFAQLHAYYDLSQAVEITLEANPDDLTPEYIALLRTLDFNRISIGIQSFDDEDLKFLNRRHNAEGAIEAVRRCQEAGFDNISIDLIYGLPNQTLSKWKHNIDQALGLQVQHISAYHLIYEEGTQLYKLWQQGTVNAIPDELSLSFFETLIQKLKEGGFIHYEISNFAREGYISQHNSSYWKGIPYLGLGPSAHSYDGEKRHYNVSNLRQYLDNPTQRETETLTLNEQYNDLLLTAIRTHWGLSLDLVEVRFGKDYRAYCLEMAQPHLQQATLQLQGDTLVLTPQGIFTSDLIMSDLMRVD